MLSGQRKPKKISCTDEFLNCYKTLHSVTVYSSVLTQQV